MNTLFMLTCMILIFLFAYFVSDRSFVNPIVLFCLPMIVSVMDCNIIQGGDSMFLRRQCFWSSPLFLFFALRFF